MEEKKTSLGELSSWLRWYRSFACPTMLTAGTHRFANQGSPTKTATAVVVEQKASVTGCCLADAANVLLEDEAARVFAARVAADSPLRHRTLRASVVYWLLSALGGVSLFLVFYFGNPLILVQTFDRAEITRLAKQGSDDTTYVGVICPCTTTILTIEDIATVRAQRSTTAPFFSICTSLSTMERMGANQVLLYDALNQICEMESEASDRGRRGLMKATIETPFALSATDLDLKLTKKRDSLVKDVGGRWAAALDVTRFTSDINSAASFKNDIKNHNLARDACGPDCKTKTPADPLGSRSPRNDPHSVEYRPLKQVRGGPNSTEASFCYDNWHLPKPAAEGATIQDATVVEFLEPMCDSNALSAIARGSKVAAAICADASRSQLGLAEEAWRQFDGNKAEVPVVYCSMATTILKMSYNTQRYLALVWRLLTMAVYSAGNFGNFGAGVLTTTLEFPRDQHLEETGYDLQQALSDGSALNLTLTGNYSRYFEQCSPIMCTYYTSSGWLRFVEAVALAGGLLGGLSRILRSVLGGLVHVHHGHHEAKATR
eukprot:g1379.t1